MGRKGSGFVLGALILCGFALYAHTTVSFQKGSIVVDPGKCEVVVSPDVLTPGRFNSTSRCTAEIATNLFSQALGGKVPLVTNATPGRVSIILDGGRCRAVGLSSEKLPRDGFQILSRRRDDGGADVFIAGVDDPDRNMRLNLLLNAGDSYYEHATLFGVYELLERYAGVRFYFPGELGTIFPRQAFEVPDGLRLESWPDFRVRCYSASAIEQGVWYEPVDERRQVQDRVAMRLRHRLETEHIPCCHGQNNLSPAKRFARTHPEYFRVDERGVRSSLKPEESAGGFDARVEQMCHTSDWWKEVSADAVSYFRGEDASVRGVPAWPCRAKNGPEFAWGPNAVGRRYFDVMPQDGMQKCVCPNCQAAFAKAKDPVQYATELIWRRTADVAQAVQDAGLKGSICQMVYTPYRNVPDFDLPSNLSVMVGTVGPWSEADATKQEKQDREIESWAKKTGGKVFLWTYVGKYDCLYLNIPDVPHAAPHAFGRYYAKRAPWIIGAYAESKSDRYLFHYLDFHLFAKQSWDNDVDAESLIAEHDRLMFGKGAVSMRKFFDILERKWVYEIAGRTTTTPLGDVACPPDEQALWTVVYSQEVMKRLYGLVMGALAAVPADSLEARRIKLMKEEFLNRMGRRASAYWKSMSVEGELARRRRLDVKNLFRPELICSPELFRQTAERIVSSEGYGLHIEEADADAWPAVAMQFSSKTRSALKPATTYRFSYFAKTKNYQAVRQNGGHFLMVRCPGFSMSSPETRMISGDFDWRHFSVTFTTPSSLPAGLPSGVVEIALRSHGAVGDIWFDGLLLEEVK